MKNQEFKVADIVRHLNSGEIGIVRNSFMGGVGLFTVTIRWIDLSNWKYKGKLENEFKDKLEKINKKDLLAYMI